MSAIELHREPVRDGVERTEAVIGMALHGNPGDAAVGCLIGGARSGRRVGMMSNVSAAMYGVEFALDLSLGRPLEIITCNVSSHPPDSLSHQYADISSRISKKMGLSKLVLRRKKADRRFDMVNAFARFVLDSGDPIWTPRPEDTATATAERVEREAESKFESPPESSIYVALRPHFPHPVAARADIERPWLCMPGFQGEIGLLIPQFKIGRYRADFGIVSETKKLVVEVDGYTYHSSRESFANDRRRDREILMKGWIVMRFPANEATYEPEACAQQVVEFLEAQT